MKFQRVKKRTIIPVVVKDISARMDCISYDAPAISRWLVVDLLKKCAEGKDKRKTTQTCARVIRVQKCIVHRLKEVRFFRYFFLKYYVFRRPTRETFVQQSTLKIKFLLIFSSTTPRGNLFHLASLFAILIPSFRTYTKGKERCAFNNHKIFVIPSTLSLLACCGHVEIAAYGLSNVCFAKLLISQHDEHHPSVLLLLASVSCFLYSFILKLQFHLSHKTIPFWDEGIHMQVFLKSPF